MRRLQLVLACRASSYVAAGCAGWLSYAAAGAGVHVLNCLSACPGQAAAPDVCVCQPVCLPRLLFGKAVFVWCCRAPSNSTCHCTCRPRQVDADAAATSVLCRLAVRLGWALCTVMCVHVMLSQDRPAPPLLKHCRLRCEAIQQPYILCCCSTTFVLNMESMHTRTSAECALLVAVPWPLRTCGECNRVV